jgi:hypothetical protein
VKHTFKDVAQTCTWNNRSVNVANVKVRGDVGVCWATRFHTAKRVHSSEKDLIPVLS